MFQVTKEFQNTTLEKFLVAILPSYSRSYLSKLIKNEKVKVNEKIIISRLAKLKTGDKIEIEFVDNVSEKIISQNIPFKIIFENEDLLVINKEEGIVVHPGAGQNEGTLLNAVKFYLGEKSQPVMVNRIDKETSGIVLVAKNPKAREIYAKEFEMRRTKKTYLCVVNSNILNFLRKNNLYSSENAVESSERQSLSNFQIYGMIGRNKRNRKIQQLFDLNFGKPKEFTIEELNAKTIRDNRFSVTNFEVQETSRHFVPLSLSGEPNHISDNFPYLTLVAHPVTGRTHQIRTHLKAIDFPILGDIDYSGEKFARLMLHSWKLEINVQDELKEFIAEIPQDFELFLNIK